MLHGPARLFAADAAAYGMNTMLSRRSALALPFATPALAAAQPAWRPAGPSRLIVPSTAGGTSDLVTRMVARHAQAAWNQPVVADNKPGSGGVIATMDLLRSPHDGMTLLCGSAGSQAIAYSLYTDVSYRPEQLIPVSGVIRTPNILLVQSSLGVNSVADLVRLMRAQPDRITHGTPGNGSSAHLSLVWFQQLTGTSGVHVPYRGTTPAVFDLIAGNIQAAWVNLPSATPHLQAGRVKALAVTSADRAGNLPDVPAMREGVPELAPYDVTMWFGMFMPTGAPQAAVQGWNTMIATLLALPETQRRFEELGGMTHPGTPAQFTEHVNAEIERWGAIVRREGLRMEAG